MTRKKQTPAEMMLSKKLAADEYARDIGGVWLVIGNPKFVSDTRDVRIIEEKDKATFMLPEDVVFYSTNPPPVEFGVYRCDKIKRGCRPQNEVLVARRRTASEAMDAANEMARNDRERSFTVGMA